MKTKTIWATVKEINEDMITVQQEDGTLLTVARNIFQYDNLTPYDMVALTTEDGRVTSGCVSCGFARGMWESMGGDDAPDLLPGEDSDAASLRRLAEGS